MYQTGKCSLYFIRPVNVKLLFTVTSESRWQRTRGPDCSALHLLVAARLTLTLLPQGLASNEKGCTMFIFLMLFWDLFSFP